ncbi:helix-turn-helix domain-containing protein [Maribellus sediminis]|uniref:helix-turn-helix domain-containing protein n=1 Tax=Maribellus sediminis TaxID=2696285 RepID=UPI00142F756C|nr:helix-turn-helix domain-containing protein [Maribellus sediminis]
MSSEKNINRLIQFISIVLNELIQPLKNQIKEEFKELKRQVQPKEPEEYLTRNEVKDLLKVDLSTIHNWTKRGKLKAYGIGNRVYYKRSEVEQAIKPLN